MQWCDAMLPLLKRGRLRLHFEIKGLIRRSRQADTFAGAVIHKAGCNLMALQSAPSGAQGESSFDQSIDRSAGTTKGVRPCSEAGSCLSLLLSSSARPTPPPMTTGSTAAATATPPANGAAAKATAS